MKRGMLFKLLGGLMALGVAQTVSAFSITPTSGTSGGNPGGLTIYEVSVGAGDLNQTFSLQWGLVTPTDNISAVGSFTVKKYENMTDSTGTTGYFDLGISLKNTSDTTISNPRITAFGFNVSPDLTLDGVDFGSGNQLNQYDVSTNFPGFQTIDLCLFSPNKNTTNSKCAGGNVNNGLAPNETDTFTAHFSLDGGLPDTVTLSDFAMKFQGVNSYELPGSPNCENCTTVPEPGTVLLLGIGLLGFGMRRKASL